ncbi:helix-turn-helix transcriptional regulator [Salmonella enterica]|nr:helix-turn-helix transcriptional regulator [Salmonella enterica]
MVVSDILARNGHPDAQVALGHADIPADLTTQALHDIDEQLQAVGFELIDDRRDALVEQIKKHLLDYSRMPDKPTRANLSDYLARQIGRDYSSLSALFSEAEGRTIEQYFLTARIEYVKELIAYRSLTLTEIAYKTGFSSVAHLSNQFRRLTGMTPSQFRDIAPSRRTPLDKI